MGTEDTASGAQAAPATPAATSTPAAPAAAAPVDPRAAALALFERKEEAAPAPADPAAAAPAAGQEPAKPAPPAEPEKPAEPPQPDRMAAGFAKLAREKAALHQEREAHKAELAELAAYKELKGKVATDPAAVLDILGAPDLDTALERVAEAFIARKQGKPQPTAEERLAALEAERERERQAADDAKKKATETEATQLREQAIEASVGAIKANLVEAKDQFPTIVGLGEERQVFDAVSAYVAKHRVPAEEVTFELVRKVAAGVETALVEEFGGLFEKVPHIATRAAPPRQETAPSGQPTDTGAKGTSSTSLASSQVNGHVPPAAPADRRMTREELRAAALAHFQ